LFNAGAEAVENAVKFAKAATGRSALLCFEGGFHGRTLLTMSLTSRHHPYKAGFGPFAPEVYRLPYPYPYRSAHPEDAGRLALEAIERAVVTVVDPASVAAAVVEPIQGGGGCAAGIAVLQVIEEEGLVGRAEQVGKVLRARWEQIAQEVPEVGEIRGVGAMIGVEMVKDRESKEPNEAFLGALVRGSISRGLIAVSCGIYHNVLRHLIPLVITDEEL